MTSRRGEVPVRLRVGVTGHRDLLSDPVLAERLTQTFARLREHAYPAAPDLVTLTVVSSLAEGADRIVAEYALCDPQSDIETLLPLEPTEYERDFDTEESRLRFRELLKRGQCSVVSNGSRPLAYENASRVIVETSDVLIALWDRSRPNLRGGTTATVEYARECGTPVIEIDSIGGHAVTWPRLRLEIARYNASTVSEPEFSAAVSSARSAFLSGIERDDRRGLMAVPEWILPYLARADLLALRLQRRYDSLGMTVALLAACAVSVAAAQAIFLSESPWLAWIEFCVIAVGLCMVWVGTRRDLQRRWLAYRALAECLRSALYLAAAGFDDPPETAILGSDLGDWSERWVVNAVRSVYRLRPSSSAIKDVDELRKILLSSWIEGQLRYFERARQQSRRREKFVQQTVIAIVVGVGAIVFVHATGWLEFGSWPKWLAFAAIALPVFGAALAGIGEQREWRRHARRYTRMVQSLKVMSRRMHAATALDEVKQVALDADAVMREEQRDWFGTMLFKDVRVTP